MKILFLANRVPYPPFRGDKLKIFNLARRLQHHELHLLTFAQNKEDLSYLPELQKIFKRVELIHLPKWRSALQCTTALWDPAPLQVLYFRSAAMKDKLQHLLAAEHYDAVHVQHLRMAPYLATQKSTPRILDLPDAFSLYWERRSKVHRSLPVRIFETIEQKRVLKYEKVLTEYNMALACSTEDLDYLRRHHPDGNLHLLPNGVDLSTFQAGNHDYSHASTLLFTGNMDYAPNVDAVIHFTHHILPAIRAKHPQVKFVIAGQRPVKKVLDLAAVADNIEITGFVKDLSAMYNSASVVVAPLRFGAGTQNKVLEAMAMGIPVVCSNIGFAGLGINNGEGAFMETDDAQFAERVSALLSSQTLREHTGHAGHKVISENFSWDTIAQMLDKYFHDITWQ